MIRTLLKLALLIAVVAFFVPRETRDGEPMEPALSPVVLFYGATQALSDLGGFCDRSPAACSSGREAASYAGARVMEGVGVLIGMATGRLNEPAERPRAAPLAREAIADPKPQPAALRPVSLGESTGSIAPGAGPRPYLPPLAQPVPAATRPAAPATTRPASASRTAPAPAAREPAAASRTPTAPARPAAAAAAPPRQTVARSLTPEPARRPPGVPGSEKPFRMPGMAGGAEGPVAPRPLALVPPPAPVRTPLPLAAPRA